jgi:phosphatidylglycerol---prolipoprotein diacylglyceryl transferase
MMVIFGMYLGFVHWDPNPVAFRLPGVGHPIVWYGVLFAVGFALGCIVTRRLVARFFSDEQPPLEPAARRGLAAKYTDRLLWFTVIGTVVGARLGSIILYNLDYYAKNPLEIFQVWHGGLASHGAAAGVIISLLLFRWKNRPPFPRYSILRLIDITVVPTALIGVFIRTGNFINQELVGVPTSVPWGVVFTHPFDGGPAVPRHAVQLYEAVAYLTVFALLQRLSGFAEVRRSTGLLAGLFFLLVFGARFWLEFFKEPQNPWLTRAIHLDMGQLMSLPCILIGAALIARVVYRSRRQRC